MKFFVATLMTIVITGAACADTISIKDGSTSVVTLNDGTTVTLQFSVAGDGSISAVGALGRDTWFKPTINAGTQPTPGPGPLPGPGPTPTPTPTPSGGRTASQVVIIYDDQNLPAAPPWSDQLFLDATKNASIKVFSFSIADVQKADTPTAELRWIGIAANKPLPYVLIANSDGTVLWQGTATTALDLVNHLNDSLPPTRRAKMPTPLPSTPPPPLKKQAEKEKDKDQKTASRRSSNKRKDV